LIAENYPQVKGFLTEICQKTYNAELAADEMFFIYSEFKECEVSLLLTSKALIENIKKQAQFQPSFMHIDATHKLIDLGLPIFIVSTETIMHSFRPIAFFISWSESKAQVICLMTKLCEFMKEKFQYEFLPKFVMSDNSDAIISGIKEVFKHEYTHLACHFHLAKNLKEKTKSQDLKELKHEIFLGGKALKNSSSFSFFKNVWAIVKTYWEEKGIKRNLLKLFGKNILINFPNGIMGQLSAEKAGQIIRLKLGTMF